jgi:hypothetical protein
VILAMGDGKRAAASMDSYLRGVYPPPAPEPAAPAATRKSASVSATAGA